MHDAVGSTAHEATIEFRMPAGADDEQIRPKVMRKVNNIPHWVTGQNVRMTPFSSAISRARLTTV